MGKVLKTDGGECSTQALGPMYTARRTAFAQAARKLCTVWVHKCRQRKSKMPSVHDN